MIFWILADQELLESSESIRITDQEMGVNEKINELVREHVIHTVELLSNLTADGLDNSTLSSKELTGKDDMEGMEELLPTLLQIFLTVGLGWAAGALGVFGTKESKGIGVFVGKFSLPALIFTSLATLDLSAIKWSFLLSMLIAKTAIFSLVMILEVALNKDASRASIFAICCTQTNGEQFLIIYPPYDIRYLLFHLTSFDVVFIS